MGRRAVRLPNGNRISDQITLGVLAKTYPLERVKGVLQQSGRASVRQRDLPAHVTVYYVIALALCFEAGYREVLRWMLEGIQWMLGPETTCKVTGKSGITQARQRVGAEPLRILYEEVVRPIAQAGTRGAWYRQWRVVSLDGSTMEMADTPANEAAFGRPGASRGAAAYPQLRLVALVENGTHVLFGTQMGSYATGEVTLARKAVPSLQRGMLCLADRNFIGYELWKQSQASGADLLWRAKKHLRLSCDERLADGSYLSRIYPSEKARRHNRDAIIVRVIEYRLEGVPDSEPFYRLLTTILDWEQAPARELAALYHERWEIETALDEFKTHLRGGQMVLRSRTPELVRQEMYGFLLAHFAIRGLMHEAALKADEDPDRLSFVHAVRVIRRKLASFVAFPPGGARRAARRGAARNPSRTCRLKSRAASATRSKAQDEQLSAATTV